MSIPEDCFDSKEQRDQHDAIRLIEIKVGDILKRPGAYLTNPADSLFAVSALVRTTKNPWFWYHPDLKLYIAELERMEPLVCAFEGETLEMVACLAIIEMGKAEGGFFTVDEEDGDGD